MCFDFKSFDEKLKETLINEIIEFAIGLKRLIKEELPK